MLRGAKGFAGRDYDLLALWRDKATNVTGAGLPCGHFLPEEEPQAVAEALLNFVGGSS